MAQTTGARLSLLAVGLAAVLVRNTSAIRDLVDVASLLTVSASQTEQEASLAAQDKHNATAPGDWEKSPPPSKITSREMLHEFLNLRDPTRPTKKWVLVKFNTPEDLCFDDCSLSGEQLVAETFGRRGFKSELLTIADYITESKPILLTWEIKEEQFDWQKEQEQEEAAQKAREKKQEAERIKRDYWDFLRSPRDESRQPSFRSSISYVTMSDQAGEETTPTIPPLGQAECEDWIRTAKDKPRSTWTLQDREKLFAILAMINPRKQAAKMAAERAEHFQMNPLVRPLSEQKKKELPMMDNKARKPLDQFEDLKTWLSWIGMHNPLRPSESLRVASIAFPAEKRIPELAEDDFKEIYRDTGSSRTKLEQLKEQLKNVVMDGPDGTGEAWISKRLPVKMEWKEVQSVDDRDVVSATGIGGPVMERSINVNIRALTSLMYLTPGGVGGAPSCTKRKPGNEDLWTVQWYGTTVDLVILKSGSGAVGQVPNYLSVDSKAGELTALPLREGRAKESQLFSIVVVGHPIELEPPDRGWPAKPDGLMSGSRVQLAVGKHYPEHGVKTNDLAIEVDSAGRVRARAFQAGKKEQTFIIEFSNRHPTVVAAKFQLDVEDQAWAYMRGLEHGVVERQPLAAFIGRPKHGAYIPTKGQECAKKPEHGNQATDPITPYTDSEQCHGWADLTEEDCYQKCKDSEIPTLKDGEVSPEAVEAAEEELEWKRKREREMEVVEPDRVVMPKAIAVPIPIAGRPPIADPYVPDTTVTTTTTIEDKQCPGLVGFKCVAALYKKSMTSGSAEDRSSRCHLYSECPAIKSTDSMYYLLEPGTGLMPAFAKIWAKEYMERQEAEAAAGQGPASNKEKKKKKKEEREDLLTLEEMLAPSVLTEAELAQQFSVPLLPPSPEEKSRRVHRTMSLQRGSEFPRKMVKGKRPKRRSLALEDLEEGEPEQMRPRSPTLIPILEETRREAAHKAGVMFIRAYKDFVSDTMAMFDVESNVVNAVTEAWAHAIAEEPRMRAVLEPMMKPLRHGTSSLADMLYITAYKMTMLNTETHNPQAKQKGFTRESFAAGEDTNLIDDFKRAIFDVIAREPL